MYDVYGEVCFCKRKKMFANRLNRFVSMNPSQKDNPQNRKKNWKEKKIGCSGQ